MILDLPTDLILDGMVAVLLAATIFFCALLDRRLKALRSGQDGLKATIDQLNTATARAELSVGQLKQASATVDGDLSEQLRQAQAVVDELSVMVSSGNKLADRLDGKRAVEAPVQAAPKVVSMLRNAPGNAQGSKPDDEPLFSEKPATPIEPPKHIEPGSQLEPRSQVENGLNQTLIEALKKAR